MTNPFEKHQEQLPYHAFRNPKASIDEFLEESMIADELLETLSDEELRELADLRRLYTDDPLPPVR